MQPEDTIRQTVKLGKKRPYCVPFILTIYKLTHLKHQCYNLDYLCQRPSRKSMKR